MPKNMTKNKIKTSVGTRNQKWRLKMRKHACDMSIDALVRHEIMFIF